MPYRHGNKHHPWIYTPLILAALPSLTLMLISGSPLYGRADTPTDAVPPTTLVRVGIFDDTSVFMDKAPKAELFVVRRPQWLGAVDGVAQFEGMMPLPTQ